VGPSPKRGSKAKPMMGVKGDHPLEKQVFEAELPEAEHFVSRPGYVMVWLMLYGLCHCACPYL